MPSLPQFQDDNQSFQMMQNRWASILNPLLINPSLQNIILKNVVLAIGSNTVNHLLQRKLQGWRLIRQRALANIYDTQDSNQKPELTLILVSDAVVTVDIEVF
jgi:hypothetical protein